MKVSWFFAFLMGISALSTNADLIENSTLKRHYMSNCSMVKIGHQTVKFCFPQFLKNQLEKEEKSYADVLSCLNKTPNFFSEIFQKQGHFTAQGNELSTVVSFSKSFKNPTILLNTTPVEEPLTGGEILILPFPSDLSKFCQKSHQKGIVSKSKNLFTKLEQAALKSRLKGPIRKLGQIHEDEVVAFYCPVDEVQYSVPYHHTIESNCQTPEVDEMISRASAHYNNKEFFKVISKASVTLPLLGVTISMFRPYDIKREKEFLCKEGIRFSSDGGIYIKGNRISTKHVVGNSKNPEYVRSIAEEYDIDPVILHTALLTQVKINSAKNINYMADNPLDTEITTQEVTVPDLPTHMPGMGSMEQPMTLDDSSFGDTVQFVTKEMKKIRFLEQYVFDEEGIITGKENSQNPFESWY